METEVYLVQQIYTNITKITSYFNNTNIVEYNFLEL